MTNVHAFKTIVFDLDGTLLDTWPSLLAAVKLAAPLAARPAEPGALRLALSRGIGPMFAMAASQMAQSAETALPIQQAIARYYAEQTLLDAQPYPHAGDMLGGLRQAGFTLGLCTNRDRASTLALLAHAGWDAHFAHIHCLDDGLPAKPDAAPLLAVVERLASTPRQTLFVGDSQVDAQCSANASIAFAAHLGGYHATPGDLAPAVLTYNHAFDLMYWMMHHSTTLMETEHD